MRAVSASASVATMRSVAPDSMRETSDAVTLAAAATRYCCHSSACRALRMLSERFIRPSLVGVARIGPRILQTPAPNCAVSGAGSRHEAQRHGDGGLAAAHAPGVGAGPG